MSTLKTINVQHPSSASLNVTLDSSGNTSVAGNLSFNSGYGSAAVAYGCRAWVNFNGTGTVAIRADGGVSSITDNGTGYYTVNFDVNLPDANFSANVSINNTSGGSTLVQPYVTATAVGSVTVYMLQNSGASPADTATTLVAVFR